MFEVLIDSVLDGVLDTVKVLPFLFLTYLLMEYLEHRTEDKTLALIRKADRMGPLFGGLLGIIPQCGFSAAASSFYTGHIITAGTLIAVYLSTSDEMLPLMISKGLPAASILRILLVKAAMGVVFGFLVDFLFRKFNQRRIGSGIHELCENEDCDCRHGLLKPAVKHTLNIVLFLLIVSILLNVIIGLIGEEGLAGLILNKPVIGEILSGLIGLIPNCAASVVITTLYMEGAMSAGAMMSGLLVGAGVGLIVLFRNNRKITENLQLTGILYVCGLLGGLMVNLTGIVF